MNDTYSHLEVRQNKTGQNVAVLRLFPPALDDIAHLEKVCREAGQQAHSVIIDLSKVEIIDGSAVSAMNHLRMTLERKEGELLLVTADERVDDLLRASRLHKAGVTIFKTLEDAQAHVDQPNIISDPRFPANGVSRAG